MPAHTDEGPAKRRRNRAVGRRWLVDRGYTVLEAGDGIVALQLAQERAEAPMDLLVTEGVSDLLHKAVSRCISSFKALYSPR
jgi:CheY-like chemotaxis protein